MDLFIEVKDVREVKKSRRILGTKNVLRGMLQFWINPKRIYYKDFFNENFKFIFYSISDWRSALATLTANNVGLLNTSHLIGGCNKWLGLKRPIKKLGNLINQRYKREQNS